MLVIGLVWALNPDESSDPKASEFDAGQPALSQAATPSSIPSPVSTATAEEATLLAGAPPPESTTLQVLDAGGGRERRRAAVAALEALGYQVVSTASAHQDVTRSTIWFTRGNEAKAQALQARDPRFADIAPSAGLSARVDLHVLVGPDW